MIKCWPCYYLLYLELPISVFHRMDCRFGRYKIHYQPLPLNKHFVILRFILITLPVKLLKSFVKPQQTEQHAVLHILGHTAQQPKAEADRALLRVNAVRSDWSLNGISNSRDPWQQLRKQQPISPSCAWNSCVPVLPSHILYRFRLSTGVNISMVENFWSTTICLTSSNSSMTLDFSLQFRHGFI